ncbi:YidC/Oxa1 family membrane protein insertase [Kribbella antiqua]|uniref:Membrane protein insertase YidC n=1 Tax=Kribbella antiqua TaxID=2512217 RepID=A0A4R2IQE0_9ACTN|nr:membrane protein insertase YidC [Kribbella antiqua]TCO46198.1 YidC/Oxa1 family membrane protein insertase [Kribbella antiqua]
MTLLAIPELALWDGIVDVFNAIMTPLYWAVSALLVGWHWLLGLVLDPNGGWAWALSIAGLTIVIRTLLIPLFVRQIRSSRNMQLLQPKMKELQKKYGHDREKLGQEMMKLYKETGTNPFSSCLPLLLQSPIFLALFRVLDYASKGKTHSSIMDPHVASLQHAKIFGAEISQTFLKANGDGAGNVKVVAIVLIILMTATMFTTQLQLMRKNMPKEALEGQAAQMQKIMLYVFPIFFLIGGFNFPIGVLIYWFVSNLWTMGQQFYVIRRNPAPGTPAYDAMEARKREHNLRAGRPADAGLASADGTTDTDTVTDRRPAQRQQPKRQSRSDRRTSAAQPASSGTTASEDAKAASNGQTSTNPQQGAAKQTQAGAAKKQPAGKKGTTAKRQPAAKSAAQKKAAQKKSGGSR